MTKHPSRTLTTWTQESNSIIFLGWTTSSVNYQVVAITPGRRWTNAASKQLAMNPVECVASSESIILITYAEQKFRPIKIGNSHIVCKLNNTLQVAPLSTFDMHTRFLCTSHHILFANFIRARIAMHCKQFYVALACKYCSLLRWICESELPYRMIYSTRMVCVCFYEFQ